MRLRRGLLEVLAVLIGFGALAVVVTWPLVLHMGTRIPGGGYGGDPAGYLWDVYYASAHGLNLLGTATQHVVTAPFGRPVVASTNTNQLLTLGPAWLVAELWTPIAGIDVALLLALTLSSAAMYLLIRWLGLTWPVAVWAGVAYMVFPYHLAKAGAHLPLAMLVSFPLVLLTALMWAERPGWRRAALLAGALGLGWLSHPYYGVMATVLAAVLVVVGLVRIRGASGARAAGAALVRVVVANVVLVGVPLAILYLTSRSGVASAFGRSEIELELYGARPTDYVVPDPGSGLMRTVFGDGWTRHAAAGGERIAFLGWSTILLAVVGLVFMWRRRPDLPPRWRTALIGAATAAVVLAVMSVKSPVRAGGLTIDAPSHYLFAALPYIRVYARFSAAVMAMVIVIAAMGLAMLMRGRSRPVAAAIAAAAVAVSLVELPNGFPVASDVPVRVGGVSAAGLPAWSWLRSHDPTAVVLETPAFAGTAGEADDRIYMYGQTIHGHPIANGGLNERSLGADFGDMLGDPRLPRAASRYATAGIRYVVVSRWAYERRGLTTPALADPPTGFAVERLFADSAVWRVTAPPEDGLAVFRRDLFWAPELVDGQVWRWMRDTAEIRVRVARAGRYGVSFPALGYLAGPYTLEVRAPGNTPTRTRVGRAVTTVSVEMDLPAGTTTITLVRGGPAAVQISATDLRVVSLRISDARVRRLDPG